MAYLPSQSPESQLVRVCPFDQSQLFLRCLLLVLELNVADWSKLLGQKMAWGVMPVMLVPHVGQSKGRHACRGDVAHLPERISLAEQSSLSGYSHGRFSYGLRPRLSRQQVEVNNLRHGNVTRHPPISREFSACTCKHSRPSGNCESCASRKRAGDSEYSRVRANAVDAEKAIESDERVVQQNCLG
jgi:hypothetical protein